MDPVRFFKCLSDDTRLKSLLLLSQNESLCVCDLVSVLQLSQPKISRHLAELRACGLVCSTRKGKWMHYALNPSLPVWASNIIKQTYKNNPTFVENELSRLDVVGQCQTLC